MQPHIREVNIHQYKGLNELVLKNLNNINILVGNNNSGKTSVLELLSTVSNPSDIWKWRECARVNTSVINLRDRSFYNGLYNMFPIDNENKKIAYDYIDQSGKCRSVELRAEIGETQMPEAEMYRMNGFTSWSGKNDTERMITTEYLNMSTIVDGILENEDTIYDFFTRLASIHKKDDKGITTLYISINNNTIEDKYLNSVLSDARQYEQLLTILKTFDDSILNITAQKKSDSPYSMTEYMVISKNHHSALPLNSYGNGMKKAVFLLCAILKCRDGILLIDEFESGIHTSAMDPTFTWLLKNALKNNTQIFLSTHSKEAVDKLIRLDENIKENMNLYTLYNAKGKSYVRMISGMEAANVVDHLGLELR